MWSYYFIASALLINLSTPQAFDPNQADLQTFDLALVGTDPSTNNASYHNPISTVNAGDPCVSSVLPSFSPSPILPILYYVISSSRKGCLYPEENKRLTD